MAWGGSWSKALSFLSSSWPTSEYVSFITHGGTWAGPPFSVSTIYTHALYPSFPGSFPGLPNGDTDYDDPLMAIMNILANGFPDRTCVHLVGDGW